MQFLERSQTIYAQVAIVKNLPAEQSEVNPSATLNEWLVPPSPEELEVSYYAVLAPFFASIS